MTPLCLASGDPWLYWAIIAGRGYGKTRTGAEWVRQEVRRCPLVNLIGATADDARDIMIEGESGILNICPPRERPTYLPSKRRLEWPNGARSLIFTADEPERLRGKQHMALWGDEVGAWRYEEAFDQAVLGLRLGVRPRALFTTTPRPRPLIKFLINHPKSYVTRGTTYDNRANLSANFLDEIITRFEGTRLGRQELMAELLDDNPGALWRRAWIDSTRVQAAPFMHRVVVAIDPAIASGEDAAECGIVVAGVHRDRDNKQPLHGYLLADYSVRGTPADWGRAAVSAYRKHSADRIVAEINQGGEMVEHVLRSIDRAVNYKPVRASRGKEARAEPISSLYEQGRVHHLGTHGKLEDELCDWVPGTGASPNRLDALVYAFTDLMVEGRDKRVHAF